jgi:hypothetical protein
MKFLLPNHTHWIYNTKYPNIEIQMVTRNGGIIHLDTFRTIKWVDLNGENVEKSIEGESLTIEYIPDHIKLLQDISRI